MLAATLPANLDSFMAWSHRRRNASARAGLRVCDGLRMSELVGTYLGNIETDARGGHWA
jgi:hypothetical protein